MSIDPNNFKVNIPEREDRDKALGEYMDAFSRTENMLKSCISHLLGTDQLQTQAITAAMMTKQMIDLLESLAEAYLTPSGRTKTKTLCEKLGRRNRLRNHIVHATWICHVLDTGTGDAIWVRYYQPISHALSCLDYDHQKVAGQYAFTIPQLRDATSRLEPMVSALSALNAEIPSLRQP